MTNTTGSVTRTEAWDGHSPIVIEDQRYPEGVEWGVSFGGHNPEAGEYVSVRSKDDAFRLLRLIHGRPRMDRVHFGDTVRAVCSPLGFYALAVLIFGTGLVVRGAPPPGLFWVWYGPLVGTTALVGLLSVFFPKSLPLSEWGLLASAGRWAYGSLVVTSDAEMTWGVSFNGPNPEALAEATDWVATKNESDAYKLVYLVGLMSWAQLNRPQSRLTNQGEA
jgi:hypothetical protein